MDLANASWDQQTSAQSTVKEPETFSRCVLRTDDAEDRGERRVLHEARADHNEDQAERKSESGV